MQEIFDTDMTKDKEEIKNMQDAAIELTTLSGYNALIDTAITTNYIAPEQEEILKKWCEAPQLWTPKT